MYKLRINVEIFLKTLSVFSASRADICKTSILKIIMIFYLGMAT
jgi:hypothetical protein